MSKQKTDIEQLWLASGPAMQKARLFRAHLEKKDAEASEQSEQTYPRGDTGDS